MDHEFEDGRYWTHSTFGPSTKPAHREIEIQDGAVRVVHGGVQSPHLFSQQSFFAVNTMVGPVTNEQTTTL